MSPTLPLDNPVKISPLFAWLASSDPRLAGSEQIRQNLKLARSWREYDAAYLAAAEDEPTTDRYERLLVEGGQERTRIRQVIEQLEGLLRDRGLEP